MNKDSKNNYTGNCDKPKELKLKCGNQREFNSMNQLLSELASWDDIKIQSTFKIMPHEIGDIKDTLRRSNV